jgi:hypothetical protein
MFISKVFSLFFVCLLAVCGNSISQTENVNQPKEKTELSLKMERSGCYGQCPTYDLTIQPDGNVLFEGKFYTDVKGKTEGKITLEQLKQLIAEIERANFFSLDNAYNYDSKNCPSMATDLPTVILSIKLNGKEKTINHYHGCFENDKPKDASSVNKPQDFSEIVYPQDLYKLENKIDEIVNTKRWIEEQK